jgi:hypothetical protein
VMVAPSLGADVASWIVYIVRVGGCCCCWPA